MSRSFKIISGGDLIKLGYKGRERGYNRQLTAGCLMELDPKGINVVIMDLLHEHIAGVPSEPHMRLVVLAKMKGKMEPERIQIDIAMEDYEYLETLQA